MLEELPSPELRRWLHERGYTFDVLHDVRGELRAAFQPFGTPDHMIVARRGRIRFERLRARDLPARAALLK